MRYRRSKTSLQRQYHVLTGIVVLASTTLLANGQLPPVTTSDDHVSTMQSVMISEIVVTGNTVVPDTEIKVITAGYINRRVTSGDLIELKNRITALYLSRGYVSSGAVLPDQDAADGRVEILIVEGTLSDIAIENSGRLRDAYLRRRISAELFGPLNVEQLQRPLQQLQQDALIRRINAELVPTHDLGESLLRVEVDEAVPYSLSVGADNYRAPSIGPYRGHVAAAYRNLTGWGDTVGGSYGITEGLDDYRVFMSVPVTRHDTVLTLQYDANDSTVVTRDFEDLDIRSEADTYTASLRHPVTRGRNGEFALTLSLERKKSETSLLGNAFSFSDGVVDGGSRITTLNLSGDLVRRGPDHVVAVRTTVGVGVDWLDATTSAHEPDGRFVTLLSQYQSIHRTAFRDGELIVRGTVRVTDDALLPLAKFAIGGHDTVRGYRENEVTWDNAVLAGLEYRLPIAQARVPGLSRNADDGSVQIAVFYDYGRGWDRGKNRSAPDELSSVGLGVRWFPGRRIHAALYWGFGLRNITGDDEHDIQDDGIHFEIGAGLF